MNSIVERLGWMLLHSLWQGAAGWTVLQLALLVLRRKAPRVRYLAGCAALVFVTLAPWVTFFSLDVTSRLETRAPSQVTTDAASAPVLTASSRTSVSAVGPAPHYAPLRSSDLWRRIQLLSRALLPWLVRAWAIGCCFYLARLAYQWRTTRRLVAIDESPVDDALRRLFNRTCQRLGLTRAVALKISRAVDVPAVVGWLKPVVLVPTGALIGLSELQIEALLAHELAHVLRHDFAINLLQEVSETLFYYHPAVRAINRCIRREREIACDELAVAVTGDPLGYAQALASIEQARAPHLAVAATGDGGDLLTRIKKLLGIMPAPPFRLSRVAWGGMAAILGYVTLLFGAPVLTAKILNARQRIEVIRAAVLETWAERVAATPAAVHELRMGGGRYVGPTMHVDGELRDADGTLVPGKIDLQASLRQDTTDFAIPLVFRDGSLSADIPAGRLEINTWPPGYAPLVAGPFLPDRNTGAVHLALRVHRGFRATLRLLDPAGHPIAGAVLAGTAQGTGAVVRNGWLITVPEHRSGDAGRVEFDDLDANTELSLRAEKDGFQTQERVFRSTPGAVTDWVLPIATIVRGRVVDAETQRPVANARIALARCSGSQTLAGTMLPGTGYENVLAITDDKGSYSLATLNPAWIYRVYVEADGYVTTCVSLVPKSEQEFQLRRGVTLSGIVKGVPPGPAKLECRYTIQVTPTESTMGKQVVELPDASAIRPFTFEHLPPGNVTLALNNVTFSVVADKSRSDVVFDATASAPPPTRTVTIVLTPSEANAMPVGAIKATYRRLHGSRWMPSGMNQVPVYEPRRVTIQAGRAILSDAAPGRLELVADGMIGFWFDRQTVDLAAGSDPVVLKIPVQPAGALEGKVIEDPNDFSGGAATYVDCVAVSGDACRTATNMFSGAAPDDANAGGHYSVSPLPLNSSYVVVVGSGYNFTASAPVFIDAAQPLGKVDIRRSPGAGLTGSVVDAAGNPVPRQELLWNYLPARNWTIGAPAVTDGEGHFTLPNVNLDVPGHYELCAYDQTHRLLGSLVVDRTTPQPIKLVLNRKPPSPQTVSRKP